MRFPSSATAGVSDIAEVKRLIKTAFDGGVNYFDTAFVYGDSEKVLGEVLEDLGIRDKILLSTKMPQFSCKSGADFETYFKKQLAALRVDYVDYLFIHNVSEKKRWDELKSWGILDWIQEKLDKGQAKNVGFSCHGSTSEFKAILDDHDWDFIMLQYNYLDENWQVGREGLKYAADKGVPVFIMEPVRGGLLADKLPPKAKTAFDNLPTKRSYASNAIRWVLDQPEVTMVLSGMSAFEQVTDNLTTASEINAGGLTDNERSAYVAAAAAIREFMDVYCTACGYCLPCPKGVSIPDCFYYYNLSFIDDMASVKRNFAGFVGNGNISACVGCKACERHCPQSISIAEKIAAARTRFGL
jgi:predicted aldo/keto reductase-like oxidoreductase